MKKIQVINWYPRWQGIRFKRQSAKSGLHFIYKWYVWIGFWEIRRWQDVRGNVDRLLETYRAAQNDE